MMNDLKKWKRGYLMLALAVLVLGLLCAYLFAKTGSAPLLFPVIAGVESLFFIRHMAKHVRELMPPDAEYIMEES